MRELSNSFLTILLHSNENDFNISHQNNPKSIEIRLSNFISIFYFLKSIEIPNRKMERLLATSLKDGSITCYPSL